MMNGRAELPVKEVGRHLETLPPWAVLTGQGYGQYGEVAGDQPQSGRQRDTHQGLKDECVGYTGAQAVCIPGQQRGAPWGSQRELSMFWGLRGEQTAKAQGVSKGDSASSPGWWHQVHGERDPGLQPKH